MERANIKCAAMEKLIADILAFCAANNMSKWDFGERALRDRPFVGQLEKGRRVWPETEAKVRAFMAAYKTDEAA